MKKALHKIKPIIFSLFWFLLGVWFVVFISSSDKAQKSTLCSSVFIKIDYDRGNFFVNEQDVERMIASQLPGGSFNIPVQEINLQQIELFLERSHYIDHAEVYIDINGKMWVDILQRYPLVRIVNGNNESYYISSEGEKMPISPEFSSRVPIATGEIWDNGRTEGKLESPATKRIYQLAKYIGQRPFWKSQIEQIFINRKQEIVLIPKLGDHKVVLCDIGADGKAKKIGGEKEEAAFEKILEKNLNKLLVFYKEGLPNVGWDTYETINLKYRKQIVCTKREIYE